MTEGPMDGAMYLKILDKKLLPRRWLMDGFSSIDYDPKHSTKATKKRLKMKHIKGVA